MRSERRRSASVEARWTVPENPRHSRAGAHGGVGSGTERTWRYRAERWQSPPMLVCPATSRDGARQAQPSPCCTSGHRRQSASVAASRVTGASDNSGSCRYRHWRPFHISADHLPSDSTGCRRVPARRIWRSPWRSAPADKAGACGSPRSPDSRTSSKKPSPATSSPASSAATPAPKVVVLDELGYLSLPDGARRPRLPSHLRPQRTRIDDRHHVTPAPTAGASATVSNDVPKKGG
jgi:hypothetical protein